MPAVRTIMATKWSLDGVKIAAAAGLILAAAWTVMPAAAALAEGADPDAAANTADSSAPATSGRVALWIGQLSDDDFAVRQAAAQQLLTSGSVAQVALAELVDAPDPEVRAAARRLITLIEQSEFDRRLDEFAADVDGRRGVTLPGWDEFGRLVGTDSTSRALFVEMQRQEAALLAATFNGQHVDGSPDWERPLFRLYNRQMTRGAANVRGTANVAPPLGSCATMLFLSLLRDSRGSERAAVAIAELVQRPPIRDALIGHPPQPAVRRLVVAWVSDCPIASEQVLNQRLELIALYGLAEALPTVVAVACGEPPHLTAAGSSRAAAILLVGRFGSAQNAADLEPLLDDHTVLAATGAPGIVRTVQVRDVALASMLHLTGQPLEDYGFARPQRHPHMLFNAQTLSMADDQQRATAADKWRAWKAASKGTSG